MGGFSPGLVVSSKNLSGCCVMGPELGRGRLLMEIVEQAKLTAKSLILWK